MNFSLNEIAYDVIEMYRANYRDTDSVDIRQVYHWVNSARAMLIKQRLDKNIFDIYEEEIQSINDLATTTTTGSTGVIETVSAIPVTISRKGYPGTITKVSYPYATELAFSSTPVQVVTQQRFQRAGSRKFNTALYYATIGKDNKLYFKTYTISTAVYLTAEGVFQNPIEVMMLNGDTDPYNSDYPMNSSLIRDLTNMIITDKLQLVIQQVEDKKTEDGRDTVAQ